MNTADIKVKVVSQKSSKGLLKGIKKTKTDVEILFCFRSQKTKDKSHEIYNLSSKKDFVIIKPETSQETLEKDPRGYQ